MARLLLVVCWAVLGCSSSHEPGGGGGGGGDGSVVRRDSGRPGGGGRDGGRFPDGGIRPIDTGPELPSLRERCLTTCDHLEECGSRLGDGSDDCFTGCAGSVDELPDGHCEDLFRRLADCLDAQPCSELRDRDPGRTRCAPEFVDIEEMCGLGG